MALLRRSKQNQKSVLPEEVSQYYQSQRRERTGVALVLGVVALIVTLLIGSALFFGGRYIYRQFANDDKPASTGQTASPAPSSGQTTPPAKQGADSTKKPSSGSSSSSSSSSQTSTTKKPSTSTSSSQAATPSLGDEDLPHTGDPGM